MLTSVIEIIVYHTHIRDNYDINQTFPRPHFMLV